jgi:hypothetical protein
MCVSIKPVVFCYSNMNNSDIHDAHVDRHGLHTHPGMCAPSISCTRICCGLSVQLVCTLLCQHVDTPKQDKGLGASG